MKTAEKEHDSDTLKTEHQQIRTSINWLEKRLKRKGPIAKIFQEARQHPGQNEIMTTWGTGVADFIKSHIPEECLALFTTAALTAIRPETSDMVDKFLAKWQILKGQTGLSDDPSEMVKNFPKYHVGSWQVMYFATALSFFHSLMPKEIFDWKKDEFEKKYFQDLALPFLKNFSQFCQERIDNLWQMADKKIAILGGKQVWKKYLSASKDDYSERVLAALCLPYFQRRFIVDSTEKISFDKKPWGYYCHQAIILLEGPAYALSRRKARILA